MLLNIHPLAPTHSLSSSPDGEALLHREIILPLAWLESAGFSESDALQVSIHEGFLLIERVNPQKEEAHDD